MIAIVISLASLGLAAAVLPDSVISWITDTAGSLVMFIAEPVINIFLSLFDGVRAAIEKIFF